MKTDGTQTRLISTIVVWMAAAAMFIFGFSKLGSTGDGTFYWGVMGIALAISPAIATWAIWKSKADH